MKQKNSKNIDKFNLFLSIVIGILGAILIINIVDIVTIHAKGINLPFFAKATPTPTPDLVKQQETILHEILPDQVDLGVSFGDTIVKLIDYGAIDKNKFGQIYSGQEELIQQAKQLLNEVSRGKIILTQANSGLLLNLLWPLGIANKTSVLDEGPMGTTYKKDVGNFASTGGWTLGKMKGGEMFSRFPILPLTKEQDDIVKEISQSIYRPCCGNSTNFPDCNHGAAMLGFIELAVTQGMPKEEIYRKALYLNSFWFPQTYADLDVYFKTKKGISWNKVDPKVVLGIDYSSSQGSIAIDKELQSEGLLPKVSGGSSC